VRPSASAQMRPPTSFNTRTALALGKMTATYVIELSRQRSRCAPNYRFITKLHR
jgi:hypothetical protein